MAAIAKKLIYCWNALSDVFIFSAGAISLLPSGGKKIKQLQHWAPVEATVNFQTDKTVKTAFLKPQIYTLVVIGDGGVLSNFLNGLVDLSGLNTLSF